MPRPGWRSSSCATLLGGILCGGYIVATDAATGPGDGALNTHKRSFDTQPRQFLWTVHNTSSRHCSSGCQAACLQSANAAVGGSTQLWGDGWMQRMETCEVECGCTDSVQHVLAVTQGLHYSPDGGASWQDLPLPILPSSSTWQIRVSPADRRNVAAWVLQDKLRPSYQWASEDGGAHWRKIFVTHQGDRLAIRSWMWHPWQPTWALVKAVGMDADHHRRSGRDFALISTNSGLSWAMLGESVLEALWSASPGQAEKAIVLVKRSTSKGGKALVSSDDFMQTEKVLVGEGSTFGLRYAVAVHVHFNFIFAVAPAQHRVLQASAEQQHDSLELYVYSAAAAAQAGDVGFLPVQWPLSVAFVRSLQLLRLQVLYSAADVAFIFLPAHARSLPWGDVFSCGYEDPRLSRVISHVHLEGSQPSWRPLPGVEGVFISNRASVAEEVDGGVALTDRQSPGSVLAMSTGSADVDLDVDELLQQLDESAGDAASELSTRSAGDLSLRTFISFDMGAVWQPLLAPRFGLDNSPMKGCEKTTSAQEPCRLHLKHWVASASSPGLIIGMGNAGDHLSDNEAHFSIFVSRDGGLVWQEVLAGAHDIEILGHGDVLIAVRRVDLRLSFSTDVGGTWTTSDLLQVDPMASLRGIHTRPALSGLNALVALSSDTSVSTSVVSIDFTALLPRECQGHDDILRPGSDFERWSPADSLEDAHASKRPVCIMGVRTVYLRRKKAAKCRTSTSELALSSGRTDRPCRCRMSDWACSPGYERLEFTEAAECLPAETTKIASAAELCLESEVSEVSITRGYVKVPGSRCEGGVDLSPQVEVCSRNVGLRGSMRTIARYRSMQIGIILLVSTVVLTKRAAAEGELSCSIGLVSMCRQWVRGRRAAWHKKFEERELLDVDDYDDL